jgi:hypothetical protein
LEKGEYFIHSRRLALNRQLKAGTFMRVTDNAIN